MNNPTHNPDDDDPAGISGALRRDARRIGEAPFDMDLQRETMARIREMNEGRSGIRFRFGPVLAMGTAVVVAVLLISFLFKPSPHREAAPVAAVTAVGEAAPRASVWSYERALAQGDAAFSAALDRDAQTLLPATPNLTGLL
jgi:hypothetical protein